MRLKQEGKSTGTINAYIRGYNSYLTWLYENGYTPERLRLKALRSERKVMKTFSEADLIKLIKFKPKTFYVKGWFIPGGTLGVRISTMASTS
jgi:hypothetical protein